MQEELEWGKDEREKNLWRSIEVWKVKEVEILEYKFFVSLFVFYQLWYVMCLIFYFYILNYQV